MRAVVTHEAGGPEVLTIEQVETPAPARGQVLIRVAAAGVNRADILQREGHYPPPPGVSDVIGLEVSGHIAAVGEDVEGWTVGDPCVALLAGGGYAEYVAVAAGQVAPAPDGVDLVEAAGIMEVAATVVSNFDVARLQPGETLLVHGGTGGIGMFAIQYATALGCRVIATAGTPEKLALCRELGADVALDYHDDWVAALKEATDGVAKSTLNFADIGKSAFAMIGGWTTVIIAAAAAVYGIAESMVNGSAEVQKMTDDLNASSESMEKNAAAALKMRLGVSEGMAGAAVEVDKLTAKLAELQAQQEPILFRVGFEG